MPPKNLLDAVTEARDQLAALANLTEPRRGAPTIGGTQTEAPTPISLAVLDAKVDLENAVQIASAMVLYDVGSRWGEPTAQERRRSIKRPLDYIQSKLQTPLAPLTDAIANEATSVLRAAVDEANKITRLTESKPVTALPVALPCRKCGRGVWVNPNTGETRCPTCNPVGLAA